MKTLLLCFVLVLLVAGCASTPTGTRPGHPWGKDLSTPPHSWHQIRFRWRWPEGRAPLWFLDALAAHRVMSPIITRHRESLPLWRFHRRAGRDAAGHQFSFIFYAPEAAVPGIEAAVRGHALTRRLVEHQLLERVYLTEPDDPARLPAKSDPDWPGPLQSTWPMFIMGVSQTWLGLIETHAGRDALDEQDLEKILNRYADVNDAVNQVWAQWAQHAFFHHLSGVFGYQPMVIRKQMRF